MIELSEGERKEFRQLLKLCAEARDRLMDRGDQIMDETLLLEKKSTDDKEKRALEWFRRSFSDVLCELVDLIDSIDDKHIAHLLFLKVNTIIMLSDGLGNLRKKSPFELTRLAVRAEMARAPRSQNVRDRREKLRPYVTVALGAGASNAAEVIKYFSRQSPADRPGAFWDVERTRQKEDVQAIIDEIAAGREPP